MLYYEITDSLKKLIRERLVTPVDLDEIQFCKDTSLVRELALDSIQILELIVAIEEAFGITCEADELNIDMFDNLEKLAGFIFSKIKK